MTELTGLHKRAWREAVRECFAEGLTFVHVGDPAGKGRQANEAQSGFQYWLTEYGIRLTGNQKDQGRDRRINAVASLLEAADVTEGVSALSVSAHVSCERLRMGFEGAYKYSENVEVGGRPEPKKDKFSHPHDAFQYVACALFPLHSSGAVGGAARQDYAALLTGRAAVPQEPETRWQALEVGEGAPAPPPKPQKWNPFIQSMMG